MKVGLFGGSFDPIHKGHISIIEGALKKMDYVVVIPTARNSFKRGRILNPAPYRYYMTCDALEKLGKRVIVSDIAGTTRDAVDTSIVRNGTEYVFMEHMKKELTCAITIYHI